VREQVANPDAVPNAPAFREPPRDCVVQAEPALLSEHADSGGGELLSERAGLIHGTVGCRNPVLEVGKAIAASEENAVATHDGHRHSGNFLMLHHRGDVPSYGIQRHGLGRM
jgi:hypothetical protein